MSNQVAQDCALCRRPCAFTVRFQETWMCPDCMARKAEERTLAPGLLDLILDLESRDREERRIDAIIRYNNPD